MAENEKPKRKRGRPPWTEEQRKVGMELNKKLANTEEGRQQRRKAINKRWDDQKYYAQFENKEDAPPPDQPISKAKQRSMMSRCGFGSTDDQKALISKLMYEAYGSWHKPKVNSDDELKERFAEFFQECAETGKIPTMEEMALCTGYTVKALYAIMEGQNGGFTSETKNIINHAREILKTFDAKLVLTGEINPIVYFFRAKNYYGMRDQQEITVSAPERPVKEMSDADIAKYFIEDGKNVETVFTDKDAD